MAKPEQTATLRALDRAELLEAGARIRLAALSTGRPVHGLGTAEIESALVAHDAVAEAAVVGYPHDIKGQGIYCYVTPMVGVEPSDALRQELEQALEQNPETLGDY